MGDARERAAACHMVRIIWTERAIANLEVIRRYIAQFFTDRLIAATNSLPDYPRRGCRELASVRPRIMRYEVGGEAPTILRIRPAAQLPDDR